MEDISSLLERFFESKKNNTKQYFDVDEIISLIDYFLDIDDVLNLKAVFELGYHLYPENINFRISLCRFHIEIGDVGGAMKMIDNIGILRDKEVDLMRIECYCELNRFNEALDLVKVLTNEDSPYLEDAIVLMACKMNDVENNNHNKTYHLIKHALTLFPDNLSLKSELCFNLELQGKTKEALSFCHELINENPYSAELWYMQGRLYSLCADFERSIESLDFALTCINKNEDPEMEYEIKLMKAYCLYKNKSYDEAIAVYDELTSCDEFSESDVNPVLAECYIKMEEYEKAYQILKPMADVDRKNQEDKFSLYGNLIYCCFETGRRKEAIDLLCDMIKLFPGSIIEYLSTFNIPREQLMKSYKEENFIIDDLARKYLNCSLHNN
jgi:pentatricopeptide repeat protein